MINFRKRMICKNVHYSGFILDRSRCFGQAILGTFVVKKLYVMQLVHYKDPCLWPLVPWWVSSLSQFFSTNWSSVKEIAKVREKKLGQVAFFEVTSKALIEKNCLVDHHYKKIEFLPFTNLFFLMNQLPCIGTAIQRPLVDRNRGHHVRDVCRARKNGSMNLLLQKRLRWSPGPQKTMLKRFVWVASVADEALY